MAVKKNTTKTTTPVALTDRDLLIEALKAAVAVLEGGAAEVEDAEVEEVVAPARKANGLKKTKAKVEPEPEPDEDEDEEEDEDEDGDEEESDREEELAAMGLRALRNILKNEHGWSPADYKGMDIDALVAEIIELESADEDEEDEDEDEDDEDEDDSEDDEDEEEDDDEGYDPDSMSDAEVRALAKENGIKIKPGLKGKALRAAVFE